MRSKTDTGPEWQTHNEIMKKIVHKNAQLKKDISKIHEEHRQILEMKNVVQNVLETATDAKLKEIRFASDKNQK